MKKTIRIEGMSCSHCVAAVAKALNTVAGVSGVFVNLQEKAASVELSHAVNDESLRAAVEDAGFDVVEIK